MVNDSPELRVVHGHSGEFELGPTLGKGKFGKVKGAVNTLTGHRVAVKIIKKSLALEGGENKEVAREVRCLQAIQHPNVLRLHDVVETDNRLYIVLDLARGGDFFEYILSLYGEGRAFSEEEGREYFRQLINGVEACHAVGVAHRDLKPENLLLREVQTYGQIPVEGTLMISDFGLSNWFRSQEDGTQSKLGTPCGSTKYAVSTLT
jgi:serine/threonine protein kinase